MAQWEGRSSGSRFGYSIFVFILKRLGVLPAYFILRLVALYYCLFSYKSSKHLWKYFHQILGYGILRSLWSMHQNYYLFGQTIIDKVVVMSGMPNPFTYEFDGEQNLVQMAEGGKGGLLISAHIGNYEIAGHFLKRLQTPVNLVMFDGEQEQIKAYLEKVAGKRNMKLILIKNDISHIYAINEALKNNELVCMHADRFVEGNKTVTKSLLGHPAPFPLGPFVLANTFKVPVSFVFAFKENSKHYHLSASPLKTYDAGNKNEQVNNMLSDYVDAMHKKIKQYPLQWYNYYDFWQKEV
ncbi:lipid A biosynthesis acyltransferase [soil metagenome]